MYMKGGPCSPIMKNCKLEGKVSQGASLYTTTKKIKLMQEIFSFFMIFYITIT